MNKDLIKYKDGYKYQLYETYKHQLPDSFKGCASFKSDFLQFSFLEEGGQGLDGAPMLIIYKGYAWDGPSGPSIDTKSFMRGALVHDALYQLMRQSYLLRTFKDAADDELRNICLEDGMSAFRAWYAHKAVKWFGKRSTIESSPVLTAP